MERLIRPAIAHASRRRRPPSIFTLSLLGAALLASCGNPPSPSPFATEAATPSPFASSSGVPSESPSPAACLGTDIQATGGPWGGAAGSRGSDIVVENRGTAACLLTASPTVAVVDQAGSILMTNAPGLVGAGPSLEPGGTIGFSVLIGNWCNPTVVLPLHVSLALASGAVDVENLAVSTTDELPPCNGPGQPATLSTSDWEQR